MNSRLSRKKAYLRPRDQDSGYKYEYSHLLSADGNDSDDENPSNERNFILQPKRPISHYVDHIIEAGDTLSSLALRYNCSVAQIKQSNHILRDNEIFALRKVRIPVSAISSWRDSMPGVHSPLMNPKKPYEHDPEEGVILTTGVVMSDTNQWTDCKARNQHDEELYDPLLAPIPLPRLPLVDLSDTEIPDIELIEPSGYEKRSDGLFNCSGADCGISWIALVMCTLVLGFLGPLIYIFFLYEHEHERNAHNSSNSN